MIPDIPKGPPFIPSPEEYTANYCEENIYLLATALAKEKLIHSAYEIYVVFISNASKRVALWNQQASSRTDGAVIWDYHVILFLKPIVTSGNQSWVYDLDTTLATPCPMPEYLHRTFQPTLEEFQSSFRVIPVDLFLKYFASDRRHMLVTRSTLDTQMDPESVEIDNSLGTYMSPPPTWPAIRGQLATTNNNLMEKYVRMEHRLKNDENDENTGGRYGSVYNSLTEISIMAGACG